MTDTKVTGYAEKELDCPEWVQADLVKLYAGTFNREVLAFDSGKLAIEWSVTDSGKWWRFCEKRGDRP